MDSYGLVSYTANHFWWRVRSPWHGSPYLRQDPADRDWLALMPNERLAAVIAGAGDDTNQ